MRGYVQSKAGSARQPSDGAVEHRTEARAMPPITSAGAGTDTASPSFATKADALMQMRLALDQRPAVKSQVALQRALDRSKPGRDTPPKRRGKPALQMKRFSIDGGLSGPRSADGEGGIIQRVYTVHSLEKFALNKVGRAHNAGIVDEEVELQALDLKFTQHFHCNGWDEKAKEFTSLTGTFVINGNATIYHYTINEQGASWVGGATPLKGAIAMKARTEQKLADMTKA